MTTEELLSNIRRREAEFDFELARCEDAYRALHILKMFNLDMQKFMAEASEMVRELEDLHK